MNAFNFYQKFLSQVILDHSLNCESDQIFIDVNQKQDINLIFFKSLVGHCCCPMKTNGIRILEQNTRLCKISSKWKKYYGIIISLEKTLQHFFLTEKSN